MGSWTGGPALVLPEFTGGGGGDISVAGECSGAPPFEKPLPLALGLPEVSSRSWLFMLLVCMTSKL